MLWFEIRSSAANSAIGGAKQGDDGATSLARGNSYAGDTPNLKWGSTPTVQLERKTRESRAGHGNVRNRVKPGISRGILRECALETMHCPDDGRDGGKLKSASCGALVRLVHKKSNFSARALIF